MRQVLNYALAFKKEFFFGNKVKVKVELIKNQQHIKVHHDKSAKNQSQLKPDDNVVYLKNSLREPARVVAKHESPRSSIIKKTTPDHSEKKSRTLEEVGR